MKYWGMQPCNFQKQIYNRFYGKESLGGNDLIVDCIGGPCRDQTYDPLIKSRNLTERLTA